MVTSTISQSTDPSSQRSHEPEARGSLEDYDDLHMFESTFKLLNSLPNDVQGEIFCYEAYHDGNTYEPDPTHAFKSTSDPDTLYHHQAMRAPDRQHFRAAMDTEIKDQLANGNFNVMKSHRCQKTHRCYLQCGK